MAICEAMARCSVGRSFGVARGHFVQRLSDQRVDQIVRLHAQALAPGNFDVRPFAVFFGKRNAQLGAAARRQRHHLIREVHRLRGLLRIAQRLQSCHHYVLQIRLPDVDDIVNARAVAKRRGRAAGGRRIGRDPQLAAIGIAHERAIVEILAQQAEFPELIGDVLADISDRAVGTHDHLAVFRTGIARERRGGHHPTSGVLALGLQVNGLALLEQFERRCPELQMQNLAFARQYVVLHA